MPIFFLQSQSNYSLELEVRDPRSMELWINLLPGEVLDRVLTLLRVSDIFEFVDLPLLIHNSAFRKAVVNRIKNARLLAHNRLQDTYLVMYLLSLSFVSKLDLEPFHFEHLLLLWHMESKWTLELNQPITISYHIWNLVAAADLLEHSKKLGESNLRYNLELEFDPSILPQLNLQYIIYHISTYAKDRICSLLIMNFDGAFTFEPSFLPELSSLWIENCDVSFSGPFLDLLRSLCLFPNRDGYARKRPIHISHSLPVQASTILLGNCYIDKSTNNYELPHQVRILSLEQIRDLTASSYVCRLIEENPHITSLTLANSMPSIDLKTLSSFGVTNVQKSLWDFSSTFMQSLQINRGLLNDILCPDTLRELNISDNGIVDIDRFTLPASLQSLKLADNPIVWTGNFSFPPNLQYLDLKNTNINTLNLFKFPDSIESLILSVNKIETIDDYRFPEKLRLLAMGMNRVSKVVNPIFSHNIQTIHFTENYIGNTFCLLYDQNKQPLKLKVLFINHNRITDFSTIKYPESVEILNVDNNSILQLQNINFSPNIRDLSFRGCDLSHIRDVTFPENSKLKCFIMSLNQITSLDRNMIKFPPNVRLLNFGGNTIEKLDPDTFLHLQSLLHLSLASNKLKKLVLSLPRSTRELDACCNKIRRVQLTFPPNSTSSLTAVNLSQNRLTTFTASMIGHNLNKVYHENLAELDVTGNKISDIYIASILDDFPKSLVACFVGYTGIQDNYGYEIGQNILDHPVCLGKRVDVSHL